MCHVAIEMELLWNFIESLLDFIAILGVFLTSESERKKLVKNRSILFKA